MKYGVIFDLDGTLMNTLEDLYYSINHILGQYGCPERSLSQVRRFVGNGAEMLVRLALPGKEDDPPVEQVLAAYQKYYNENCRKGTASLYPGVRGALAQIRQQCPVAVVSNKPDPAVKTLCAEYFDDVFALGVTENCPRKPAPDMVYKAMEAIGVEKCVYVGDSEVDVATAKNAGVPCLSVLWGFRDKEELLEAGATHFCTRAEDLLPMIEEMMKTE